MDSKVNKSGDTMTGNLFIEEYPARVVLKANNIDFSTIPSEVMQGPQIILQDKNNQDGCFINSSIDRYDGSSISLYASNGVGSDRKAESMGIWIKKTGEKSTWAPASSYDNSILTTVGHGSSYVKLGNGLIIQWGGTGGGNVTFYTPFSTNVYAISLTLAINADGQSYSYAGKIKSRTNTGFNCYVNAWSDWIAIGY